MAARESPRVLNQRFVTALLSWLAALTATLIWPAYALVLLCLSEAVLVGLHIVEGFTAEDQAKRIYTFVSATMDLNVAYLHFVVGVPMVTAAVDAAANVEPNWDTVAASATLVLLSAFAWIYAGVSSTRTLRKDAMAPEPGSAVDAPEEGITPNR